MVFDEEFGRRNDDNSASRTDYRRKHVGRREVGPHLSHALSPMYFPLHAFSISTDDAESIAATGGGGGGGLGWVAQVTSEKPSLAGSVGHHESRAGSAPPVDLLAAALSGNTELVEGASTSLGPDRGPPSLRVIESSSRRGSSAIKQLGAKPHPAAPAPGSWITGGAVGASPIGNSMEDREDQEGRDDNRGGDRSRVDVGVQWEEGGGETGGAPSPPPRSSLPPWAKPYSRPTCPAKNAVRDGNFISSSDTDERAVEATSTSIQCGESVLGG